MPNQTGPQKDTKWIVGNGKGLLPGWLSTATQRHTEAGEDPVCAAVTAPAAPTQHLHSTYTNNTWGKKENLWRLAWAGVTAIVQLRFGLKTHSSQNLLSLIPALILRLRLHICSIAPLLIISVVRTFYWTSETHTLVYLFRVLINTVL